MIELKNQLLQFMKEEDEMRQAREARGLFASWEGEVN